MRLLLLASFVSVALAQSVSQCEDRLPEVANRFANDYNAYMHRYHIETLSAKRGKDQDKQRSRIEHEFEAVKRCECW